MAFAVQSLRINVLSGKTGKKSLTHYSLDVFFRTIGASFGFKRVSCPQSKRERFVILSQKIIDLACEEGSRIAGFLGKFVALIQRFSENKKLV
jgi:hypothetical protein